MHVYVLEQDAYRAANHVINERDVGKVARLLFN